MEQMHNNEPSGTPKRRRRRRKTAIPMPEFLTKIGEDVRWYYDVRLWILPILLVMFLILGLRSCGQDVPVQVETEPAAESVTEPVTEETQVPVDPDAQALAILAESVGAGRSNNVKTIIMWVAINRSEDRRNGYGQSLVEEIERPNQWQGYDGTVSYSQEVYEMALNVLETQRNGGLRPLDDDMLWLVLNDDGSVTARNQFAATGNQKWREKTVR